MLLRELLEKKLNIKHVNKSTSGLLQNPKGLNYLGAGWQAVAFELKKRPGVVVKTIMVDGENDPQYQFLRVCKNHPNNPYFPNVFHLKMYNAEEPMDDDHREDEMGKIHPHDYPPNMKKYVIVASMEKLEPFSNLSEEEALQFLNSIGIQPKRPTTGSKKYREGNLTKFIPVEFRNPVERKKIASITTDANLKQALRILEPLFNKFHPDVHGNNIMLRDVGGTYQLVFIDPISDPDGDSEWD